METPTYLEAAYDDAPRDFARCTLCNDAWPVTCPECKGEGTLAAQRLVRLKAFRAAKAVRS